MYKKQFYVMINMYIALVLLSLSQTKSNPLRSYNNPLNGKLADVFLVVDESNQFLSSMGLGLMKTALNNIATELNPSGTSPYFGVYFYGAASSVSAAVPFPTSSASSVKTQLDNKQYTVAQSNPSTLTSALNSVSSSCASYCRSQAPRVTVVLAGILSSLDANTIRQLERSYGMTVIVVGIGSSVSLTNVNILASYPTQIYGIHVSSLYELILVAQHIGSVVSDVPRQIYINQYLSFSYLPNGVYHTVQLNTFSYSSTNETVVMFATNCPSCGVYGSLSEPNPTSVNTPVNSNQRSFFAYSNYPNSLYYFRIPQNTPRFYISVLGSTSSTLFLYADVFTLPRT